MSAFQQIQQDPRFATLDPDTKRHALAWAMDKDFYADPRSAEADPEQWAAFRDGKVASLLQGGVPRDASGTPEISVAQEVGRGLMGSLRHIKGAYHGTRARFAGDEATRDEQLGKARELSEKTGPTSVPDPFELTEGRKIRDLGRWVAGTAPQVVTSAGLFMSAAWAGAKAGGKAGFLVAGPKGAAAGALVGGMATSALTGWQQYAGGQYADLRERGVDHDAAAKGSDWYGLPAGLISILLPAAATMNVMGVIGKDFVRGRVKGAALGMSLGGPLEGAAEYGAQSIMIAGRRAAGIEVSPEEAFKEQRAAGAAGMLMGIGTGAIGGGGRPKGTQATYSTAISEALAKTNEELAGHPQIHGRLIEDLSSAENLSQEESALLDYLKGAPAKSNRDLNRAEKALRQEASKVAQRDDATNMARFQELSAKESLTGPEAMEMTSIFATQAEARQAVTQEMAEAQLASIYTDLTEGETTPEVVEAMKPQLQQMGIDPAQVDQLLAEYHQATQPEPVVERGPLSTIADLAKAREQSRLALPAPEGVTYGHGFEMRQPKPQTIIRKGKEVVGRDPEGDYTAGREQNARVILAKTFPTKQRAINRLLTGKKMGDLVGDYDVFPTRNGQWQIRTSDGDTGAVAARNAALKMEAAIAESQPAPPAPEVSSNNPPDAPDASAPVAQEAKVTEYIAALTRRGDIATATAVVKGIESGEFYDHFPEARGHGDAIRAAAEALIKRQNEYFDQKEAKRKADLEKKKKEERPKGRFPKKDADLTTADEIQRRIAGIDQQLAELERTGSPKDSVAWGRKQDRIAKLNRRRDALAAKLSSQATVQSPVSPETEGVAPASHPAHESPLQSDATPQGNVVQPAQTPASLPADIRPPSENLSRVVSSTYESGRVVGDETVAVADIKGGVSEAKDDQAKVAKLAKQIASPEGYFERIIIAQDNTVVEGAHRLAAARALGLKEIPVVRIADRQAGHPVAAMREAVQKAQPMHNDQANQVVSAAIGMIDDAGSVAAALEEYDLPAGYEAAYRAALEAAQAKKTPETFTSADGNAKKTAESDKKADRPSAETVTAPSETARPASEAEEPAKQASTKEPKQEAAGKPATSPAEQGEAASTLRGGGNTIFTADMYQAARERMRARLNRLNAGLDPEMVQDGIIMAGFHIEQGARTFAAYAKAMIADMGEAVKPYLKSWYMAAKFDPRLAGMDGLSSAADVEASDVGKIMVVLSRVKDAAQAAAGSEPSKSADQSTLATHDETMKRVHAGDATLAEYKAAFQRVVDGEQEIAAELSKMTKQQLLGRMGGTFAYRYKNEKKDRVVRAAYQDMLTDFWVKRGMFSYGMDGILPAIKNAVESTTEADLAAHAKALKDARAERKANAAEAMEAVKDPKTLADFRTYFTMKRRGGTSFRDVYMGLTPEQRATYDELVSAETRSRRKDTTGRDVRAADVQTTGEIVATKHTKTGADLFVVQAGERVERGVYQQWNATAKKLGGWYSSYRAGGAVPGFQFKTKENAEAFKSYLAGETGHAQEVAKERRDAFADDRSQTAAERLNEMADRLEARADEVLAADRKVNTSRRAQMANRAEANANADKALAKTMRNLAAHDGKLQVRQKVQVEELARAVKRAKHAEGRVKHPNDYGKQQATKITTDTASYAEFPTFTANRYDLAALGRILNEQDGTKKLGARLLKEADDVTAEYLKFAKENTHLVATFAKKDGTRAVFASKADAETALSRSGFRGKAVVLPVKRGENLLIMSPALAKERGVWKGDDDKRITIPPGLGMEIVEKSKDAPWQFQRVKEELTRLRSMNIETPAELRAALREFIALQEAPAAPSKVKELEREMVGRVKDGLDFFPPPADVAQEMVEAADIQEGMTVLEPSAGMGHIAEQIREAGVEPDVVEMSGKRRELLEAKGFNVVGQDFLDTTEKYDRIVMNPPFSERRDAAHVQHAYSLLKPNGRVVAIMGEGVFFGQDKKSEAFRGWLDSVGGISEKLAEGTFQDPSLPVNTSVNARLVVIDKQTGTDAMLSMRDRKALRLTSTIEATRAELSERLGEKAITRLEESGKLNIVRTMAGLPAAIRAGLAKLSQRPAGIDAIKKKYTDKTTAFFLSEGKHGIKIASLIVKPEYRKSGVGSAIMQDIIAYADATGQRITLSPGLRDDGHGTTSRGRLVKFYKRFGFLENKGRNKDFTISDGMYRLPTRPLYAQGGQTIVGAYEDNQVWLVSDAIQPGEAFGVLAHEVGHALLDNDPAFQRQKPKFLADFERLEKLGSTKAKAARAMVPANTGLKRGEVLADLKGDRKAEVEAIRTEEALFYMVQQEANKDMPLYKRIIGAIKMALMRWGMPVGRLSESDFVSIFTAGAKRWDKAGAGNMVSSPAMLSVQEAAKAIYSKLENVAATGYQGMKAQGVKNWLIKQGVKKAEIEAVGVDAFLADRKPTDKVTQDELLDFVRANAVEVEDVVLGDFEAVTPESLDVEYREGFMGGPAGWEADNPAGTKVVSHKKNEEEARIDLAEKINRALSIKAGAQFATYQEPGAEEGSYREMFVTAPKVGAIEPKSAGMMVESRSPQKVWRDGHFPYSDVPNPIVRIRFNEVQADGKRILRIEEMQGPSPVNQKKMPAYLRDNIYQIATKRAIAYAKENGFDGVAFAAKPGLSAGATQADRYSLSKKLNSVEWAIGSQPGKFHLGGETVEGDSHSFGQNIPGDKLVEYVGKDNARRIIEAEASGDTSGKITGVELDAGGHGLKRLYDHTLPKMLEAYGKGKMETVTLAGGGKLYPYIVKNQDGNTWRVMSKVDGAVLGTFGSRADAEAFVENDGVVSATYFPITTDTPGSFPLFAMSPDPKVQALADKQIRKLKSLYLKSGKISPAKTKRAIDKYETLVATLKDDKVDIYEKQKALEQHIIKELPLQDRGRALQMLKMLAKSPNPARREALLQRSIERVNEIHEAVERKQQIEKVDKILERKAPKKDKDKGVQHHRGMGPEGNRLIGLIRGARRLSLADGQNKAMDILEEIAVREEGIARGTIEPRANEIPGEPSTAQAEQLLVYQLFSGLEDKSTADIRKALATLEAVVDEGQNELRTAEAARKEKLSGLRETAMEEFSGGEGALDPDVAKARQTSRGYWRKIADKLSDWDSKHQSWEFLLDKLTLDKSTGALKGKTTKYFTELALDAHGDKAAGITAQQEVLQEKLTEIYGLSGRKLAKALGENSETKAKTGVTKETQHGRIEIPLSQNEGYKLWQMFQQPSIQEEMTMHGYDTQTLTELNKYLKPEVKEWAQWQVDVFYPEYRGGINEVYKEMFYVDMPSIEGYSPIRRLYHGQQSDDAMLENQGNYASVYSQVSGIKSRTKNSRGFNIMDGDSVLLAHIHQMEHFKAFARPVREMRSVLGSEMVQNVVKQHHGEGANFVLMDFINAFARDGQRGADLIPWLDSLRANFTRSVIGANPVVFLKQLASIPAYNMDIPASEWAKGFAYALTHPATAYKTLMQSRHMRARYRTGFERDLKLALQRHENKALTGTATISDHLMLSTKLGDKLAIVLGGYAAYRYHLGQGKSHNEALKQFDLSTKRSQQAADTMDMAWVQRMGGSIGKMFTMFLTAPMAYYRNTSAAVRNLSRGRGSKADNAKRLFVSWALLPMLFQWVASGFDWEDEKQLRAAIVGPLTGLFILREFVEGSMSAIIHSDVYQGMGTPPPLTVFSTLARALRRIGKATKDGWGEDDLERVITDLVEVAGNMKGIPTRPIRQVGGGVRDLLTGETDDIRRAMGYSERALERD